MSTATRILSDDAILAKRDRDSFNAGFEAGVDLAREMYEALKRIVEQADSEAEGMMPLHTVSSVIDARHLLAKVTP